MSALKIHVLDDEMFTTEMLKYHLELNPDNDVKFFSSGKELMNSLSEKPDMVCLDDNLDGENGGEILPKVLQRMPELPEVLVSGQEDVATAVELLQSGAYDYIVKDENVKERLWSLTNRIRSQEALTQRM